MDTIEVEAHATSTPAQDEPTGATQRAQVMVSDIAGAARSAVQSHAPAVLGAGRSTAGSAYGQMRQASDEQLATGATFAAGIVTGFVLARVPRPLLLLALVPLIALGGTLLGRRLPFVGRALRSDD